MDLQRAACGFVNSLSGWLEDVLLDVQPVKLLPADFVKAPNPLLGDFPNVFGQFQIAAGAQLEVVLLLPQKSSDACRGSLRRHRDDLLQDGQPRGASKGGLPFWAWHDLW